MIIPIVMVVGYSLQDNVITEQEPGVRGRRQLRRDPHRPGLLEGDRQHSLLHPPPSVPAHLVLGLSFACCSTAAAERRPQAFFRGLYVLPWLFTVASSPCYGACCLAPNGIVNFI